jgi:hypothetical protein
MPTTLPLTRTARLADFPGCCSPAEWQQRHALDAYDHWEVHRHHRDCLGPVLCYNWGAASFCAPGEDPIYRGYGDPDVPIYGLPLAVVIALSVLDRVDAPLRFLHGVTSQLQPGGLVVCTFAAWDASGEDCAVGHELRHRIYDRDACYKLLADIRKIDLQPFGGVDLRYRGDVLGDHTLVALTMIKTERRI